MFLWKCILLNVCHTSSALSKYNKCSKISNTSLSVFNEILVYRTGTHQMHVRIANGEDPNQTDSKESV